MQKKFNSTFLKPAQTLFSGLALVGALFVGTTASVFAGEADVLNVVISKTGDGKFRIETTVKHDDTGWDHYADRWDVVAPDGTVIGSRILHHPHENEQPFTRSLTLSIPANIKTVTIRANDSVHELGGQEFEVDVPH